MAGDKKFTPYTTEQKKEFGKQFSKEEKTSYRKGQRNAYSHMANTAKRESFFIGDNLKKADNTRAGAAARQNESGRAKTARPTGQAGLNGVRQEVMAFPKAK